MTSYVKKTKRGGIMKVVREHYMRDDIYCGFRDCESCSLGNGIVEYNPVLVKSSIGGRSYLDGILN